MLRTIHFHGALADQVGHKEIPYDFDTPAQALAALLFLLPDFKKVISEVKNFALVARGGECQAVELGTINFPLSEKMDELHIFPTTEGAGVETITAIAAALSVSTLTATVIYVAINIAIAFAVGAIIQSLAPSADATEVTRAEERPSFIYNGALNSAAQGAAIPLVYGTHMTGSLVISRGVTVEELPYEVERTEPPPGGTTPGEVPAVEPWQWTGNGA